MKIKPKGNGLSAVLRGTASEETGRFFVVTFTKPFIGKEAIIVKYSNDMGYILEIANANIERLKREAEAEKRTEEAQKKYLKEQHWIYLTDPNRWSESDYDTRHKGDHVELYHIPSGEGVLEAFSEQEAWRDLREELYGS